MTKKANIIELNGKRYDARTGSLLDAGQKGPEPDAVLDHKSVAVQAPAPKRQVMDISRPPTQHLKHHKAHKSQTLMRNVVSKPEPSLRRKAKVTSNTQALVGKPEFQVVKKLSHPSVDSKRLKHAKQVPHSAMISRFGAEAVSAGPVPAHHAVKRVVQQPTAIHAVQAPVQPSASLDVFERALQRANSHLEPATKPARKSRRHHLRKRTVSIGTGALAILLLLGFLVFQNQAGITMRYASNKAGFAAELPSYRPDGYKASKFIYSPGIVGVNFNNGTGQNYKVVQQESTWDSAALLNDYVASSGNTYDAVRTAGQTIYTFGNNNATWVNGGVWYRVISDGNLTTNDLINIASSM